MTPDEHIAAAVEAPCPTCEGRGVVPVKFMRDTEDQIRVVSENACPGCKGSGVLGVEGVLRLLGMEQVGWALIGRHTPERGVIDVRSYKIDDLPADSTINQIPVFAALPKENDQ